ADLVGSGGLRLTDEFQRVWHVCGSSSAADGTGYLAISFEHDALASFRQQCVGYLAMQSADVLSIVRGQNVLAAIELLIWLVWRRSRFSSWGFNTSPLQLLAAVGR